MNDINTAIINILGHLPPQFSMLAKFYRISPAAFGAILIFVIFMIAIFLRGLFGRRVTVPPQKLNGAPAQRNWDGWSTWGSGNPYGFTTIEVGSISENWTIRTDPANLGISNPEYDRMWRPAGPARDV